MGIRNYLRIIPFLLTATGIFFGHSDHPILYLFLTILIILSFYLHSRLPIWMFLFIAQVLIHLSGDKLVLFYLPILILISDPVITAAFIGSEIVVHLQKGGLFTFTYPIAIFVVIAYLLRNWLKEKHDNLKRELELIKKRSEFILTTEADTKQLLAGIKTSPHPAIYRPILHFLSYLRRSLAAQTVAFFYRSGDDLVLTLGASTIKGFREGVRVGVESGILGHVVKEKREVIIPEYGLPVKQLGYYADPKIEVKSLAVVPVLFGDELEGVLVIDSATRSYTTADREILRNASSTLAYLTGMVRLYEQQRRNAIHYSALYEMAKRLQQELDLDRIIEISAQVASAIFECDHVGIARVDPEINRGEVLFSDGLKMIKPHTSFSLDEGLVGWIAKYRRYLLNNQLKKGKLHRVFRKEGSHPYHSFIGVPIMAEEDVLGVIWVESRVKSAFREEDSELLNFLAFQLSLAWNRANLHKKVSELAISDSLTGLYNHRHFHEERGGAASPIRRRDTRQIWWGGVCPDFTRLWRTEGPGDCNPSEREDQKSTDED